MHSLFAVPFCARVTVSVLHLRLRSRLRQRCKQPAGIIHSARQREGRIKPQFHTGRGEQAGAVRMGGNQAHQSLGPDTNVSSSSGNGPKRSRNSMTTSCRAFPSGAEDSIL